MADGRECDGEVEGAWRSWGGMKFIGENYREVVMVMFVWRGLRQSAVRGSCASHDRLKSQSKIASAFTFFISC